ncbi:MAG: hypothetical protein ACXVQS_11760 [Actinomycetota bacterium]
MKRYLVLALAIGATIALLLQAPASSQEQPVLEFNTMASVTGPFVGSTNPIRGINGGGLPWRISSAHGVLSGTGRLQVTVQGLVLAAGPKEGTNPIANFNAIVSCETIQNGSPATANMATSPFPATTTGNAEIHASVALPSPCIAPIVFVGPNPTTWFAATGRG